MEKKILYFIKKFHMLDNCRHVIVGLSGGADSVCLLLILHSLIKSGSLAVELTAVHINHGIRGEEADCDERFAKALCENLHVSFVSKRVDIPLMAKQQHLTEEEAGRITRYAIFEELAIQKKEATVIAVAHHLNDQTETVLMNLLRGSSLRGASGMQPVRGRVIRPLLCVTREEIESYLLQLGIQYRTDSTNADNAYLRNRIRNQLIPYLQEQINPGAVGHIAQLADSIGEADRYITKQARQLHDKCVTYERNQAVILLSEFASSDYILQKYVIGQVLEKLSGQLKDIYRTHFEAVIGLCSSQVGKSVDLPYKIKAVRGYDHLILQIERETPVCSKADGYESYESENRHVQDCVTVDLNQVPEEGTLEISFPQRIYTQKDGYRNIAGLVLEYTQTLEISANNDYTKYFDCDKIKQTIDKCISLRFRQDGDRITIHQNGESRKLKKEFIDRKIPSIDRDSILLLATGQQIIWAVGVRSSENYRVLQHTDKILKISVKF